MSVRRIGAACGVDRLGHRRFVSIYRDRGALKLSGPSGSCLIATTDPKEILIAVACEFSLADVQIMGHLRSL